MTESDVPRDQDYGVLERGPDSVTLRFTRGSRIRPTRSGGR
jgi:hypothetical protein